MKNAIFLMLLIVLSGCSSLFSDNEKYVGTWLVTHDNGRLERLSLYPDFTAKSSESQWAVYNWSVLNNEMVISYRNGSKEDIISRAAIENDKKIMKSTKNSGEIWYSNYSARKISNNPDEWFDLYEVCKKSKSSNTWQCNNTGRGGYCYSTVPWEETTSLTLDECKSQCVAFLEKRRNSEYAALGKGESCANYDKNGVPVFKGLADLDNDGDTGRSHAIDLIAESFINGGSGTDDPQFQKLDSTINEWISTDSKLADGRQKINFISFGFKSAFKKIKDRDISLKKLQELKQAKPKSAYVVSAEAEYWISYALEARGFGYASSVTPEGRRLSNERMLIAERILLDNKELGSTFPDWYQQMVIVQYRLGKIKESYASFIVGASRYKNYLPLYIVMRNYSEPKWGGSWKQVDGFINMASSLAGETEELSMYARLYYGVYDNMDSEKSFFKDTLVDWKKLKLAYEDLAKRNPDSFAILAEFSDLSCAANDKDSYIKIRKKIGNNIFHLEWGGKESPLQCDIKFGYSE